jgi:hypothetical protein
MEPGACDGIVAAVKPPAGHRQLCTIELIASGHAERCPGEECAFWEHGCALTRIEYALEGRPDLAGLLVDLRRELDSGRELDVEEVHSRFSRLLNADEHISDTGGNDPPK